MKHLLRFHLLALLVCAASASFAQTFEGSAAAQHIEGCTKVVLNETNGHLRLAVLEEDQSIPVADLGQWLRDTYGLPNTHTFPVIADWQDANGQRHLRMQQYADGYPIAGTMILAHLQNGSVQSVNGDYVTDLTTTQKPGIAQTTALNSAMGHIDAKRWKWEESGAVDTKHRNFPSGHLGYQRTSNGWELCWNFELYASEPLSRDEVFVNATTGAVEGKRNLLWFGDVNGSAITAYSGTQTIVTDSVSPTSYRLQETGRGGGVVTKNLQQGFFQFNAVDFTDADNTWNNVNSNQDEVATDAHWAAEMFYDYFNTAHSRSSYDGSGAPLNQFVHYATNYPNAFWDGSSVSMGDGDGSTTGPWTSVDIIAHEYGHGLVENSANLAASYESGAIGEGYADIIGTLVEAYAKGSINWTFGEDIMLTGSSLRNLASPNSDGRPDTYQGTNWEYGATDNGGVHTNSAVMTYWFYLLVNGGAGANDNGDSYNVSGIGTNDAASIMYRALTNYLTSNSQFADARTYTIQAATDLFGNCATEVTAVTNAWYAVGVGSAATTSPPSAAFTADITFSCSTPQLVNFTNSSTNASSYQWAFGDGGTSTATSPSHTYTVSNTYDVTLIASGTTTCGVVHDTLVKTGYVVVSSSGGPGAAACSPNTTGHCCNMGIYTVNFASGQINNTTGDGADGYQDYTCAQQASVTAGNGYSIQVITGTQYNEDVRIWIDFNNDGSMTNGELVFQDDNVFQTHSGTINIPSSGVVLNTPLRMRVTSDYFSNTISSSCSTPQYGQTEDYTVVVTPNTVPPTAAFSASPTTINVGGTVAFTNSSNNGTSYVWSFPGASPSTSTATTPTNIVYNAAGTYDVSLIATNAYGADTTTISNYITVVTGAIMCTNTSSTATSGTLYDSGGPSGNYSGGENCYFLIDPGCSSDITLSWSQMAVYSGDALYVYDGATTGGTLLYSGATFSLPGNVTATSGQMLVRFISSSFTHGAGFAVSWNTTVPTVAPVAAFSASSTSPVWGEQVDFTDATTNTPISWEWTFGDGASSTSQNPSHTYTAGGTYTVQLIVDNCFAKDTITTTVVAQGPPTVVFSPDSINTSVSCGDSLQVPITVYNTGAGALSYSYDGIIAPNTTPKVLLLVASGGVPNATETGLVNTGRFTTADIDIDYAPGIVTTADLSQYDVVFTWGSGTFSNGVAIGDTLKAYVDQGGAVILATYSLTSNWQLQGGIFDAGYSPFTPTGTTSVSGTFDIASQANPNHPIFDGLTANPTYWSNTNFSNPTVTTGSTVLAVDPAGNNVIGVNAAGNVMGLINYPTNVLTGNSALAELYANMLYFLQSPPPVEWVSVGNPIDTVAGGDSTTIMVTLYGAGLPSGTYGTELNFTTNDPSNTSIVVPCTMNVSGPAILALSDTCLDFGSVMQGTTLDKTIEVYNTGCDTLQVTNVTVGSSLYSPQTGTLALAPGDTGSVTITFAPSALGTFNSNFTIFTNAGDSTLCLKGIGQVAPAVSVSPTSITTNIVGCNDSTTVPVTVSNTGGADLIFTIDPVNTSVDSTSLQNYTSTGAATTHTFSGVPATDSLYVEINMEGDFNATSEYAQLYINGDYIGIIPDGNQIVVSYTYAFGPTQAAAWLATGTLSIVVDNNTGVNLGYADEHQVRVIIPGTDWLSTPDPASYTVVAGSSAVVNVPFTSVGTEPGQYISDLTLNTNVPGTPTVIVPCTLNITGLAEIAVQDTCLDFGTQYQGVATSGSFDIENTGCDTLFVTNIAAGLSDYVTTPTSVTIDPYSTATIAVDFTAVAVGSRDTIITLTTSVGDTTICVTGTGQAAPDITVTPNPITASINGCNDSTSVDLIIENTGGASLTYNYIGSSGGGYDSTQSTVYTSTGAFTTFTFDNMYLADSLFLEITMEGDFNSTFEYADLYIDGAFQFQIQDNNSINVFQTYAFGGSQVAGWLADGIVTIGLDNNGSVNTGYADIHMARVSLNSVPWLTAAAASGTLSPGATDTVPLTFYSAGVSSGVHTTDVLITSNDPGTPTLAVPCTLTVSGVPTVALASTSLTFGSTMVGTTLNDSTTIYNVGCDTLTVTNVLPSVGDFGADTTTFFIPPNDSMVVGLNFTPASVGTISGSILIFNNDVDTFITVSGTGLGAPNISLSPTTIAATVNCGDSVTVPLVVGNIGAGDLDFDADFSGNSANSSTALLFDPFENGGYSSQWTPASSNHTYNILTTGCPVGNGCLEQVGGGSHYSGLDGSFTASTPSYVGFWVKPGPTNLADSYVLLRGSGTFIFWFYARNNGMMGIYNNSATNAMIAYTPGQWYNVEMKNIDFTAQTMDFYIDGVLIQAAFPFRSFASSADQLQIYNFHNTTTCMDHVVVGDGPVNGVDWMNFTPDSGLVVPAASDTVFVTMSAAGLSTGVYTSELELTSNDPVNPSVMVPCTMTVSGPAAPVLSDTCMQFGNYAVGTTPTDTVYLYNYGCDSLDVTNILPGNSAYTVLTATSAVLYPEDTLMIVVQFAPTAIQSYNSDLQIFSSNSSTLSICLEGSGTGAPIISITPTTISASLSACGDSVIVPVTIGNIGAGDLHFTLDPIQTLHDSTSTINFFSSGYNSYHYFSNLNQSDSIYITVTLNGDYDNSNEYATLTVDGTYMGIVPDNNQYNTPVSTTYAFGGTQVATWLADGAITVLVDNTSGVDAIAPSNYTSVTLQSAGAVSWASASPGAGTVTVGGSQTVNVQFNSVGLNPGQYISDLVVNSDDANNSQIIVPCTLDVVGLPCADFSYNISACTGAVGFTDQSSNTPTSWAWDFGGLGTSTSPNPTWTFTSTGTYAVQLITTNALGSDTSIQVVTLTSLGGPVAASCTPATTGHCCNMGVYNLTFAGINNTSNNGSVGYEDFSCTASATVTEGDVHSISVTTGTQYQEDVVVWIDYDNNGVFATTEQILTSYNTYTNHSGTVTIPTGTAVLNTPLRMRVGSDYYSQSTPNGCNSVLYGQYEDYTVIIVPQSQPPVAGFNLVHASSCSGDISLTDASGWAPTSWTWNFGDNTSSTAQNPSHSYTAAGTYTVQLIACNNDGCDSTTQSVTITGIGAVAGAACYPQTTAYCCGFGIYSVNFNTISKTSNAGSDGYQDYTCTDSTTVYESNQYTLTVTTSPTIAENVAAWIDYNNDGAFTSGEQVLSSPNTLGSHTVTFTIPTSTAVLYTPLRMRIGSEYYINSMPDGCSDVSYGQYEDYSVSVEPNNVPPISAFNYTQANSCEGEVVFAEQTTGLTTSLTWNFGDNNSSTLANPTHTYAAGGTYTVELIACNTNGCDTATQTVTVAGVTDVATATCYPQTTTNCCGAGITNVTLNTINYSSADGSEGYQDVTCIESTDLTVTYDYTMDVTTGGGAQNVVAWIDYNNDGSFTASEQVMNTSGTGLVSATVTPPASAQQNVPLRMRVGADLTSNPVPDGCSDLVAGQYEDYRVVLYPDTAPPVADFIYVVPSDCEGIANFTDLSTSGPAITTWDWNFGDSNTSTSQNPTHTYAAAGTYTVSLTTCNAFGCHTSNQQVTIAGVSLVLAAVCAPQTSNYCCGFGVTNVNLGTINNTTGDAADGYVDYSCSDATDLTIGQAETISITTGTNAENVRAWIDYNNDGAFTAAEEVLSSSSGSTTHSGSVTAPITAVTNTPLRMRVGSESNLLSVPDGCTILQQGQYEDYAITIYPDSAPPVPAFTYVIPNSCEGDVIFTESSTSGPAITSWTWDFGDANNSNAQNPTHTYAAAGSYTVQLTVCNQYGCQSTSQTVVIAGVSAVATAACYPQTTTYCCGYGITNVTLSSINNTTTDAAEGYQDFSCSQSTSLTIGIAESLSVTTGTNTENVRVWIDYDNDGSFTSGEEVMSSTGLFTHAGTVTAPGSAVTSTPLRMRVGSESTGNAVPDGCTDLVQGQYEDYSVTIFPDTTPPVADFSFATLYECQGVVEFTDLSLNGPSTWLWTFGDSNNSSDQFPTHTYAAAGTYTVSLTVCNAYGCNGTSMTVVVSGVSPVVAAACYPQTTSSTSFGYGISNVSFNTINNSSADGTEGYRDFTCSESTTVTEGTTVVLEVSTSIGNPENVQAWIDYNNDGVFDNTELVMTSASTLTTHNSNVVIPASAVQNTPLRMRVGSDNTSQPMPDGCTDVQNGQYEDYTVTIEPDAAPPVADFLQSQNDVCSPTVTFFDLSDNAPTSWIWDFGDGNGSSDPNPTHTYAAPGVYTVTLTVTNVHGDDGTTQQVTISTITAGVSLSGSQVPNSALSFTSNSPGAISWNWTFGDGGTSTNEDPTHTYADTGMYTVTLIATNLLGCSDTATQTVEIVETGIYNPLSEISFSVQPNPTRGAVVLLFESKTAQNLEIYIHNGIGQVVTSFSQDRATVLEKRLNLYEYGSGVYYVRLKAGDQYLVKRVVVH